MIELIGANKRVLEVGCATGYMSKVLTERGCRVTGVELDPEAARKAEEHCEEVIVGDIETLDLTETLGSASFEAVVFGDVLEHLRDSLAVLRRMRPLLAPEGFVVASIPNVAHGAVRLALLRGQFEYRPLGLLDDTHLRFFTRDSVEELFRTAGFVVVEMRRTTAPLFETEIPLNSEEFSAELLEEVGADPEATTYQFVVKAVLDNGLEAVRELHDREEAQRVTIFGLQREVDSLKAENSDLAERFGRIEEEAGDLRNSFFTGESKVREYEDRWARLERHLPVRIYRRLQRLRRGS